MLRVLSMMSVFGLAHRCASEANLSVIPMYCDLVCIVECTQACDLGSFY